MTSKRYSNQPADPGPDRYVLVDATNTQARILATSAENAFREFLAQQGENYPILIWPHDDFERDELPLFRICGRS